MYSSSTVTVLVVTLGFYSVGALVSPEQVGGLSTDPPAITSVVVPNNCPESVDPEATCPSGCFQPFPTNMMNMDGSRPCTTVRKGHYSPFDSNYELICQPGTHSPFEGADDCLTCPPGFHTSEEGAEDCLPCAVGSYSELPGATSCNLCDPTYYDGEASDTIQLWRGQLYCYHFDVDADALTEDPTQSPSEAPSTVYIPSAAPSAGDEEEALPTGNSTIMPGLKDETTASEDAEAQHCLANDTYIWHGTCIHCPSKLMAILHPISCLLFLFGLLVVLARAPSRTLPIIWMGVEYLQLANFIGLVPLPNKHELLILAHRSLAVFALEWDVGFSWQCIFGFPLSLDQTTQLILPFLVTILLSAAGRTILGFLDRLARWIGIGLYVYQFKLILTSLEALECTSDDWICRRRVLSRMDAIVGLSVYVILFPLWLLALRKRHCQNLPVANIRSAEEKDEESSHWVTQFGMETCWWWPGLWICRKMILACLPFLLKSQPSLMLVGLLGLLMATELIQRFAATPDSNSSPSLEYNIWMREATVDIILQASLISLAALSFFALAVPAEQRQEGFGIGICFWALVVSTLLYWLAAVVYSLLNCGRSKTTSEVPNVTSSSVDGKSCALTVNSSLGIKEIEEDPASETIRHSLSLVPAHGPGDDLEIESVAFDEESAFSGWHCTQDFEEWRGTGNSVLQGSWGYGAHTSPRLRKSPRSSQEKEKTGSKEIFESCIPSNRNPIHGRLSNVPTRTMSSTSDSNDELMTSGFVQSRNKNVLEDDASTLTDLNTYVSQATPRSHQDNVYYHEQLETATSRLHDVLLAASNDGTHIFADTEDDTFELRDSIQEVRNSCIHSIVEEDAGEEAAAASEEDEEPLEVWIDEATGLPVDKNHGEWADAATGLRVPPPTSFDSRRYLHASGGEQQRKNDNYNQPPVMQLTGRDKFHM